MFNLTRVLYIKFICIIFSIQIWSLQANTVTNNNIIVGAAQAELYLDKLKNQRIGLIVNQTSRVGDTHLVDFLVAHQQKVQLIFAPEHGFRGDHDAGEKIKSGVDEKTGINIYSIYGKTKKPSAEILKQIDVLIFDIQDVGVRYYTYISSMHYMMEAAGENNIPFIVLDRPNPNGFALDGPVLDMKFQSFVGMHPIPLLHGMTVGELALMINAQGWLKNKVKLDLSVIPVKNYKRNMSYSLPVKPSPNLPNDRAISLYPSLGFFESTPVSIGRGTDFPFQVIGFNEFSLGNFQFRPRVISGAASHPKLLGKLLQGEDLRAYTEQGLSLKFLLSWHDLFKKHNREFFTKAQFMDKLAGTNKLRLQIQSGLDEKSIRESWQAELKKFDQQRQAYLLYQ